MGQRRRLLLVSSSGDGQRPGRHGRQVTRTNLLCEFRPLIKPLGPLLDRLANGGAGLHGVSAQDPSEVLGRFFCDRQGHPTNLSLADAGEDVLEARADMGFAADGEERSLPLGRQLDHADLV